MTVAGSAYIRWAKSRERFRFNLGRSSIRSCPEELLEAGPEDFHLAAPNTHGWPPLLEALGERYAVTPGRIHLAVGCSMANHLVMAALLERGDHVLVERPGYPPLAELPAWLGARVGEFERSDDWRLDPGQVERRLRPETRLVVLTDPHNPTGAIADPEALDRLGHLAERDGFHVLVDEVYREFTYRPGEGIAAHRGPRWISTCSLTKAYGLDGIRAGWLVAAESIIDRVRALNDLYGIIMPHPTERLALRALERIDDLRTDVDALLEVNRPRIDALVARRPELGWEAPPAGPVGFVRLRHARVPDLVEILEREHDTTVTPGALFGREDHFRLGFGMPTADLETALPGLEQALDRLTIDAGGQE